MNPVLKPKKNYKIKRPDYTPGQQGAGKRFSYGSQVNPKLNPAEDLEQKAAILSKRIRKTVEPELMGEGLALAGGGIRLAGGALKSGGRKKTVRAPKGMPRKVSSFIRNYPKLAMKIIRRAQSGQGGAGVSDVIAAIGKTLWSGLKATVKTGAKELLDYAIQHPREVLDFALRVLNQMGEDSPEEQMALLSAIDPEEYGQDEGPAFFEGQGLKKEYKKAKKGVKKGVKKGTKVVKKGAQELYRHPSENIGKAGDILSIASLIPGPQQPIVKGAALGAQGTAKVLKAVGKGKRKPTAYQMHMKKMMGSGHSMKDAAAEWRRLKNY